MPNTKKTNSGNTPKTSRFASLPENVKEARKRALRLLEKRDYSRKMLIDKLTEKGASDEEAAEVADWLCETGVVNDARYAELVVRHYARKGYGRRRITEELYRRGRSPGVVGRGPLPGAGDR